MLYYNRYDVFASQTGEATELNLFLSFSVKSESVCVSVKMMRMSFMHGCVDMF